MTNIELFKQKLETYKTANSLSEQDKIIKEVQNLCSNATFSERKEMLKLAIETGIDVVFEKL